MADNASETKPQQQTKPKAKYVEGNVTLQTGTFDPNRPDLLDQAAAAFAELHKGEKVSNVSVTMLTHHVGESVTYHVSGEIAG